MNALKQLQTLYDQELHSNVIYLAELTLSFAEQKQDIAPQTKYEINMLYADSLYHTQQYLQADNAYSKALQIRKYITKSKPNKGSSTPENGNNQIQTQNTPNNSTVSLKEQQKDIEINIKYKMYLCRIYMKQQQRAIEILQTVPARTRIPKVNMALGDLYMEAGLERSAATCYKEVLRESSSALLAAEKLLKLGVKGIEVNSLMIEATSDNNWINVWLRGQAQMHSKEFANAINTFKSIEALRENQNLLVTIAYCYVYLCNEKMALKTLQRVLQIDNGFITGRDLLATLLAHSGEKEDLRELERLATIELETSRWACEHWIVMGWYMHASKKYEKAAYFGHQACLMQKCNVEALLLKAHTFMAMSKHSEAVLHFKDAIHHSPQRFEGHNGLVEANFVQLRYRDGLTNAANACKVLNNSPQALTLYASVLMKDSSPNGKVRNLLEKAIADDPSYTPAVCLFVEYLDQDRRQEEACQLLQKYVEKYPSSKMHQLLAEILGRMQKDEEAFTHYNAALRLDPQNQSAIEGLNRLGQSPSKLDSSLAYFLPPELPVSPGNNSYASQGPSVPIDDLDMTDPDQWGERVEGDTSDYYFE